MRSSPALRRTILVAAMGLVPCAAGAAPGMSSADEASRGRAQDEARRGQLAMQAGTYDEALRWFEASLVDWPSSAVLGDLAEVYVRRGEEETALVVLRSCLASYDDDPTHHELADRARRRIAELEARRDPEATRRATPEPPLGTEIDLDSVRAPAKGPLRSTNPLVARGEAPPAMLPGWTTMATMRAAPERATQETRPRAWLTAVVTVSAILGTGLIIAPAVYYYVGPRSSSAPLGVPITF